MIIGDTLRKLDGNARLELLDVTANQRFRAVLVQAFRDVERELANLSIPPVDESMRLYTTYQRYAHVKHEIEDFIKALDELRVSVTG